MKILISNENMNAHYYIRMGYARALTSLGHEVVLWDINKRSAFDAFDQLEPNLFWGQTYNLNSATIKCIEERPHLYVILRAPDNSIYSDSIAKNYPILTAQTKELKLLDELRRKTGKPHFLHCHYTQESLNRTHERFIQDGYKVVSMMNGADTFAFCGGSYKEEFASDIAFVGGRWGYKAQNIDPYILQLCSDFKYNIKIFGNQPWGIPQYCGFANDQDIPDIFSSAKICPSISEPHSTKFGYDIIERPFKLMAAGAFVVSDYVQDLVNLIPEGVYAKTPQEFKELVDYFLDDNTMEERLSIAKQCQNIVMNEHTYLCRAKKMLEDLGC